MKIAIISDSHDNIINIDKVLNYLDRHKICKLIHCGDLTSRETLLYIVQRFIGIVWIVRGNADIYVRAKAHKQARNNTRKINNNNSSLKFFEKTGEVEINGVKIAFTHKPKDAQKLLKKDYDYVFYGHTHRPDIKKYQISNIKYQKDKEVIMANPGNLMGQPYEATFAVLDTKNKKLELKIINTL